MIIIEGADNVGKTTLIQQLMALDPKLSLLKRKKFNPNRNETIGTSYLEALANQEHVQSGYCIADRFMASECIYGDLFRGGCRMSDTEHFTIRKVLSAYHAIIIHCDAPDEKIIESWKKREQLYNDPLVIARAYRKRIGTIFPDMEVIRYDWTSPFAPLWRLKIIQIHQQRMVDMKPDFDNIAKCIREAT